MNKFMHMEINNQIMVTKNFVDSLRLAAMRNDNTIDMAEMRTLSVITKAAEKYIKVLEKEAAKYGERK